VLAYFYTIFLARVLAKTHEHTLFSSVCTSKLSLLLEGHTAGMAYFFYVAMNAIKFDKSILHYYVPIGLLGSQKGVGAAGILGSLCLP
jgi:hypothetical protein